MASGPYSAGTIFLQVVPSYRDFQESVRRNAREAAKTFDDEYGQELNKRDPVGDALAPKPERVKKAAQEAAKQYGGEFQKTVKDRLSKALSALPQYEMLAGDANEDQERLRSLRKSLARVFAKEGGFDVTKDLAKIADVAAELDELTRKTGDIDVRVGGERAIAELAAVGVAVKALGAQRADIEVDIESLDELVLRSRKVGEQSGQEFGGAFQRKVRTEIAAAIAALPDYNMDANLTEAQREIAFFRQELVSILNYEGSISVDKNGALRDIRDVATALKRLEVESPDIDIRVGASEAIAKLSAVGAAARDVAQDVDIDVDVDAARALASYNDIARAAEQAAKDAEAAAQKMSRDAEREAKKMANAVSNGFGGKFQTDIRKRITAAMESLPDYKPDADLSDVQREVQGLRQRLKTLLDLDIDIDMDDDLNEITKVAARLQALSKTAPDIEVRVDSSEAVEELALIGAAAVAIGKLDPDIDVDVNSATVLAELSAIAAAKDAIDRRSAAAAAAEGTAGLRVFNAQILAIVAVLPLAVPLVGGLVGVLAGVGPAAAGAGLGLGAMIVGFTGLGDAVKAIGDVQKNGAKEALQVSRTISTATRGVRDAQQALDAARERSARSAEDSGRRVSEAAQGVVDAERRAAEQVEDAQEQVVAARERLADAVEAQERQEVESARQIERARTALTRAREAEADALERSTEAVATALERAEDAERSLADAQERSTEAQEAVTDARREATRDLEDLSIALRSGALAEQEALLDLAEAQRLAGQFTPGDNSATAQRARIDLEQQRLKVEELRLENARLAAQQVEAAAAGVEGSERVQNALQRERDAQQDVVDAQEARVDAAADVQRAERDRDRSARDSAEAVADAEQGIVDARQASADAAQSSARAIRDAEKGLADAREAEVAAAVEGQEAVAAAQLGVRDALRDQRQAAVDSALAVQNAQEGLADAQQRYADALTQTGDIGTSSVFKLRDALSELGPAGREFAYFISGLLPFFRNLRTEIQEGFLPGVQSGLQTIIDTYGPGLTDFAGRMGDTLGSIFDAFGTKVSVDPAWRDFFSMLNEYAPVFTTQWAQIFENVARGFGSLLTAFAPFSKDFGDALIDLTNRFATWAASLEDNPTFKRFVDYLKENGAQVATLLGTFALALINLGEALAPYASSIVSVLIAVFDFIANMDPALLGAITTAILGFAIALQLAALAWAIFSTASLIIGASNPIGLIVGAIALAVTALILLYQNSETARNIMQAAFSAIGKAAQWLWNEAIKPAFEALVAYYQNVVFPVILWLWNNVVIPAFQGIAAVATWLWVNVLKPVFEAVIGLIRDRVAPILLWLWENVVKPVFRLIADYFTWAWNTVIKPVLGALVWFFQNVLFPVFMWLLDNVVRPVFENIVSIIQIAWKAIEIVLGALELFLKAVVGPVFMWLYREIISPVWDWISEKISNVWNTYIKPVFEALGNFIEETVAPAFGRGVDAISSAWDKVVDAARKPVEFIVNEVINKGIIGTFNGIAKKFDVDPIDPISLPWQQYSPPKQNRGAKGSSSRGTEFAQGGVLPGTSRWQDGDDQLARVQGGGMVSLRRGEGIAISEAMAVPKLRDELLRWNAIGVQQGAGALHRYAEAGFAKGGFIKPAPGRITSGFGPRWGRMHSGVDWGTPSGTPVVAAADGTVSVAKYHSSWGNHVKLSHAGGLATNYAHFTRDVVSPGQVVKQGQVIGYSGNTGNSTGPHLHFEIYQNGKRVDPVPWLTGGNAGAAPAEGGTFMSDLLKKPFEGIINKALETANKTALGRLGVGMVRKGVNGIVDWAKEKFAAFTTGDAGDHTGFGGGGVERWRSTVHQALDIMGLSRDLTGSTLRRMNQESGGNPRAENDWDSNAAQGYDMRSKGLMQVIGPTFRANAHPDYNKDIFDPLSNILASMRYAMKRYKSLPAAYDRKGGYSTGGEIEDLLDIPTLYDQGGIIPPGLSLILNKTGKPEVGITNEEWKVIQEIAANGGASGEQHDHYHLDSYAAQKMAQEVAEAVAAQRHRREALAGRRR